MAERIAKNDGKKSENNAKFGGDFKGYARGPGNRSKDSRGGCGGVLGGDCGGVDREKQQGGEDLPGGIAGGGEKRGLEAANPDDETPNNQQVKSAIGQRNGETDSVYVIMMVRFSHC